MSSPAPPARIRESLVFVGGGEGIDTAKAIRWGIGRLWYEQDDPVASPASLAACRQRGVGVGLKRNGTGAAAAEALSQDLTKHGFGLNTGPYTCGAMLDDELHDAAKTLEAYRTFRRIRPRRLFVLAFEALQGGALDPRLIELVNDDPNTILAPFLYIGLAGDELYPVAERAVIEDLTDYGVHPARIVPFLAAKSPIPYGWEGYLYGFDQLPASPPAPL